jgi:hypothetical protein
MSSATAPAEPNDAQPHDVQPHGVQPQGSDPSAGRTSVSRRRLWLAGSAVATIALGLAVHRWMPGAAGDFTADAAYAVLIYLLVATVAPRLNGVAVFLAAVVFCFAIELAQLSDIPLRLAKAVPLVSLVLGTTFAPRDLLAYVLGALAVAVADCVIRRAGHR